MGSIAESTKHRDQLQDILASANLQYHRTHSLSKKSHEDACKYMPGGNTRTVLHVLPFPLTIKSGESCYLTTIDGHTYVDFLGEYTAGIYGHNNPIIRQAIEQALDGGWNYGGHSHMEQQLAKVVCERFPAMELVRFVNSGTEANTMALATAIAFTRKKGVLLFNGAYHGGTISGHVNTDKININLPHEFYVGAYNDLIQTRLLVGSLKDKLAAIIVEPMMGSGGCYPAKPEFLHLLHDLATQNGIVLIFDEVMTSRLAYHGFGNAHGVKPDLMTLGKWVGGGMTFGAFGGREQLMRMYDPRSGELIHAGTFNNNVFTMSAGIAGCGLITEDRLRSLNKTGDDMRESLRAILKKHGIEGTIPESPITVEPLPALQGDPPKMFVTGIGSMMNIHFSGSERDLLQGLYYHHMLDSGNYMAQRGFVALNIEIDQGHIDRFIEATDKFCQRMRPHLQSV